MQNVIAKDDALNNISANVRLLLAERGWSQRELARRIQEPPMTVSRVINITNLPTLDVIANIAEAFGVTIDDLIESPAESSRRKKPAHAS